MPERRPASEDLVKKAWASVRTRANREPRPELTVHPPEPGVSHNFEPPDPASVSTQTRPRMPTTMPTPPPTQPRPSYIPIRASTQVPPSRSRDHRQPANPSRTIIRLVRIGIVAALLFTFLGGFFGRVIDEVGNVKEVTVAAGPRIVTGDIVLNKDQNGQIIVEADGVTIDCDGFAVLGSGEGNGIVITDRIGVRIVNCNIGGFQAGIHLVGGSDNSVDATKVSKSLVGIVLARTSGNTISNSTFIGNGTGLLITSSSANNSITNNTAAENTSHGFISLDDAGENNRFLSNTAEKNGGYGFVDASAFSPEGRYQGNLCDANANDSSPDHLCSLSG